MTGLGKMYYGENKIFIGNFDCGIMCGFGVQICLDRMVDGFYVNGRI